MKKIINIFCLLFILHFMLCAFSFAQEKVLTRKEMIKIIDGNLSVYGDKISSKIPSLVTKTDRKGRKAYLFKTESGKELNFKNLDEETLTDLYRQVSNEATRIGAEKLNEQLEQLKKIPKAVAPPTYKAPEIPKIPGGLEPITPPPVSPLPIYKEPEPPIAPVIPKYKVPEAPKIEIPPTAPKPVEPIIPVPIYKIPEIPEGLKTEEGVKQE